MKNHFSTNITVGMDCLSCGTFLPIGFRCKGRLYCNGTCWARDNREHTVGVTCIYCGDFIPATRTQRERCDNCDPIGKSEYKRSPNGKRSSLISTHKRLRNMEFIILFDNIFPDSLPIEYHHLSDGFVVPIPRFIHKQYLGKNHREKMRPIVEMMYNISYLIE